MEKKDLKILYVEDEEKLREYIAKSLKRRYKEIYLAKDGKEGVEKFLKYSPDIIITDIKMPIMDGISMIKKIKQFSSNIPIIITTAFNDSTYLIEAIELKVDKFIQKPLDFSDLIATIENIAIPIFQKIEIEKLKDSFFKKNKNRLSLGVSEAIKNVEKEVDKISKSDYSVIIQGETGVGKSFIASIIHKLSNRKDNPFIAIDIGAIPDTLIESELFGYEKGAFTGANKRKKGFFEVANGGTIFLDELENMSKYAQSKILRAVEEKKIYPVGDTKPVDVNIRIIAATNKDIKVEVAKNRFREDLYYRLGEYLIDIPPLRHRVEDIKMLSINFLKNASKELDKNIDSISKEGIELLLNYDWKGNIRELKNIIRKAVLISERTEIDLELLKKILSPKVKVIQNINDNPFPVSDYSLESIEKWAIIRALKHTKGKKLKTATILGIDYKTLIRRLKKYHIIS